MNTEQLRADFEAWYRTEFPEDISDSTFIYYESCNRYQLPYIDRMWSTYQAGRAALQSQVKKDTTLFCDLKTDEEKYTFFLMGRGYETGVIAQAIQNDVAMAYHRCAEYKKELETLQSQDRGDAAEWLKEHNRLAVEVAYGAPCTACSDDWHGENKAHSDSLARLIDHARRVQAKGCP